MVWTKFAVIEGGWIVPVNSKGGEDWVCPKCNHEHESCCGNSHFPCTEGPIHGGTCQCHNDYDVYENMPRLKGFVLGGKLRGKL